MASTPPAILIFNRIWSGGSLQVKNCVIGALAKTLGKLAIFAAIRSG
jgi:hypothetical protein